MKVCVYFGGEKTFVGRFTGIGTAVLHQKEALRRASVPLVENPWARCDIFHANWFHPPTVLHILDAKARGEKVVLHAHATPEEFKNARLGSIFYGPMRTYLVWFYNLADLILVPSLHTKKVLRSYGVTPPIRAISNGVADEFFTPDPIRRARYRHRFALEGLAVFNVGQVVERKGVRDFLDAARRLPETKFIWFGKRYERFWEPDASRDVPRNVKFTGFVTDIVAAFNAGDIFFFPSFEENQGIVILEAAALGKPIVVRDIATYRGWLVDGVNCLKARSGGGFVRALKLLLGRPALRRDLGKGAHALARTHRLDVIGRELARYYRTLEDDALKRGNRGYTRRFGPSSG